MFAGDRQAAEFARGASGGLVACRIRYFHRTDSTNVRARRLRELGWPEGTLVVAEHQTAGRGRLRRKWFCPEGAGILVSVVVPSDLPHGTASAGKPTARERGAATAWLTAAGALAMSEAVELAAGVRLSVEWPNDIVARDPGAASGYRKLGGVLVESSRRVTVLGAGLNVDVGADEFPEDLRARAGSLRSVFGVVADRRNILADFVRGLEIRLADGRPLADEMRSRSATLGRTVALAEGAPGREGLAVGFDEDMRLVVELPGGERESVARIAGPTGA